MSLTFCPGGPGGPGGPAGQPVEPCVYIIVLRLENAVSECVIMIVPDLIAALCSLWSLSISKPNTIAVINRYAFCSLDRMQSIVDANG